jgi:hypothetical protein
MEAQCGAQSGAFVFQDLKPAIGCVIWQAHVRLAYDAWLMQ